MGSSNCCPTCGAWYSVPVFDRPVVVTRTGSPTPLASVRVEQDGVPLHGCERGVESFSRLP